MQEVPEHQGNSTDSSGSSLGSAVTACKKILCSNSLLESTDYWLQNQRTPCQIGFLEDKSESNCASLKRAILRTSGDPIRFCHAVYLKSLYSYEELLHWCYEETPSNKLSCLCPFHCSKLSFSLDLYQIFSALDLLVCFVNLDANRDDCSNEQVKQKLISVSPNLPKLISSMNVQPPKENEIVLLSGLTSGNLQADYEVPQCPWQADVCLVQCARGDRKNSASCIIFEINKFLIGLELVQERQLQIEAHVSKPEDDTNCSVSSIEEDFLTASEHLEEENEADEYKTVAHEKISVSEASSDVRKNKGKGFESFHYRKARLPLILEGSCVNEDNTASNVSEAVHVVAEDGISQPEDKPEQEILGQKELVGRATSSLSSEDLTDNVKNSCSVNALDASLTKMAKEELGPLYDSTEKPNSKAEVEDCAGGRKSDPPLQNKQAATGQYATNLAESVLQDAFIRLSQSQPTFSEEAAVSISVGSSCKSKDASASRSWNELPKIVIVQSPDSSENVPDWPGSAFPNLCHWTETEGSEVSDYFEEDHSNGHSQSALEMALACAATVIGTISSPQAAEKFRRDQEATDSKSETVDNEDLHTDSSQLLEDCTSTEYSFPSALCGMTQVASAVAVCGLGETKEEKYPATSSGLLSAAQTSAAITLHCSIAVGSSMEKLNDSIAEALLKEASIILTKPNTYKNVGHFMESINGRIIETAARPRIPHSDGVIRDELAQNLSNIILRHSIEEVRKKRELQSRSENSSSTQDIFMETANELLFNVIYFTCKKMNDIRQVEECSPLFSEGLKGKKVTRVEGWPTQATACETSHRTLDHSAVNPFGTAYSASKDTENGISTKINMRDVNSNESATVNSELTSRAIGHNALVAKTSPKKRYLKRTTRDCYKSPNQSNIQKKRDYRSFSDRESTFANNECRHGVQEQLPSSVVANAENQAKRKCDAALSDEVQVSLSLLGNHVLLPSQPVLQVKNSRDKYCITDFAEELAETVVSMATEIAAICLENSNGKQPWFCAWKRGNEYLVTQSISCRTMKRKKETHANGSVVRKHRAPRLSEIKRKTDEHPELKERLMNRVVDESINLEDTPDSVNIFANEVAAKIMNLTELSMVDSIWQGPNHPRNRLHCERWSRAKASSCESIPEEDTDSKASVNTLGLMNAFGQPVSQTSSVSKQSSCESITDEFSRFMVNQMENEGRGFDLLLDYYAGKNANNILTSALQQVAKKNGHLNVRPSCPSKQSSTESITEEFYRYMLKEIEKENKDNAFSPRSSKDWCGSLLPPSLRSPFCFRQSSVPDGRSSGSRLTVNIPVKANSLDGFAQHHQDSLSVQPVSTAASSGLCKSDSCLYQRCKTDQITDMLIHETWASSIESLMRKNKIITDEAEVAEVDRFHSDSPPHVQQYANRLAANIVENGKNLIAVQQDAFDSASQEHVLESKHPQGATQIQVEPRKGGINLDEQKEHMKNSECLPAGQHREVPLIQIETDQRDESDKDSESLTLHELSEKEHQGKEKPPEAYAGKHMVSSTLLYSKSTQSKPDAEITGETKAAEEFPAHLSSSEESTGSWSQLANDEDNPDDTSSYLQLSERSLSNGNSSTTSSLGIMDLEIYQENVPPSPMINDLVEEKVFLKEQTDNTEESTSGLSVGTANYQKELLVINFDLEPECPNAELRATLQWIAASELGIPTIYFKKSQENRIEKFLDVVQLVQRKSWKVGDIFHAVVQYCKLSEESKEKTPSLFDWLLELG